MVTEIWSHPQQTRRPRHVPSLHRSAPNATHIQTFADVVRRGATRFGAYEIPLVADAQGPQQGPPAACGLLFSGERRRRVPRPLGG